MVHLTGRTKQSSLKGIDASEASFGIAKTHEDIRKTLLVDTVRSLRNGGELLSRMEQMRDDSLAVKAFFLLCDSKKVIDSNAAQRRTSGRDLPRKLCASCIQGPKSKPCNIASAVLKRPKWSKV